MHFGMFMEFGFRGSGPGDDTTAEAFREGFSLVDAAERWGLDSAWLSEFHFMPDRSVLSSPIVTAGAIAARTTRIRIGIAVYVLPLTNPLRVAEEVATVDQISNGRFDLGVGRSGFVNSYNSYAVPYQDSEERFDEGLAILREAWKGQPFSFAGEHYRVDEAQVVPQPVQRPHPPMRMAATSAATFEKVAREGLPLFVGLRGDGLDSLRRGLERYRAAWHDAAHSAAPSAYLRVPVFAADNPQAAFDEPRSCILYYFERQAKLMAEQGANRGTGDNSAEKVAATLAALRYEDILESRVAFGSAEQLVDRLTHWRDELGLDGIVMELNAGGLLSEDQVLDSLRIITHDVMPALQ